MLDMKKYHIEKAKVKRKLLFLLPIIFVAGILAGVMFATVFIFHRQ